MEPYTRGEIVLLLRQLYEQQQRLPMTTDFVGQQPTYRTMQNVFGVKTWDELLTIVFENEHQPSPPKTVFTQQMVKDLFQRFYREYQRVPRATDIQQLHRTHPRYTPSVSTILKLFDGLWNQALIYSGLPIKKKSMQSAVQNANSCSVKD